MPSTLGYALNHLGRHRIDRRGSKNGRAKLNEQTVNKIREEFDPSITTMTEIAKRHGVSVATISKVLRGEYWSHC